MKCSEFKNFVKIIDGISNEKIWIWGAGDKGKFILEWLLFMNQKNRIKGFIDSDRNKQGTKINGIEVFAPTFLLNSKQEDIIVASSFFYEISESWNCMNVRFYDVSSYAKKSKIKQIFKLYKNRRFILIHDKKESDAIYYFEHIGVKITDIINIGEVCPEVIGDKIIIIIGRNHIESERQLIKLGYSFSYNYIVLTEFFYEDYCYVKEGEYVEDFDKGSIGNKGLKEYFCPIPFTQLFYYDGWSDICSPTWNHAVSTGDTWKKSVDEIWNSSKAKEIRESILSGSFYFCNEELCWRLLEGKLFKKNEIVDKKWLDIIKNNKLEIEGGPEFLNLGFIPSCNINCSMCREAIIPIDKKFDSGHFIKELKKYNFINLKRLILPGNGELFYNEDYMYVLKHIDEFQFPNLEYIWIYSNGLLFTEEKFNEYVKPLYKTYKIKIFISIDGYYKETYEKIRYGRYEILTKNLKMLAEKRKKGLFDTLLMAFVVQKDNFREMTKFVDYAKSIGADCVHFEKLFSNPIERSVHRIENVYYEEFVEELGRAVTEGERIGIKIDYMPFKKLLENN